MTAPQNHWAKRALEREREKRGYLCQNNSCSFTNWDLTFAHLQRTTISEVGRGRGRKERLTDIRKYPHAYVLLCWDCHVALDRGHIESLVLTIHNLPEVLCLHLPRPSLVGSSSSIS